MLLFIVLVVANYCCNAKQPDSIDINAIIKNYRHSTIDSLKLVCATFIKNNKVNLTSEKNKFNLSNSLIEETIDLTVNDWQKCPWNKSASKDLILNYLLPYQICNEDPIDWRDYFSKKYKSIKDSFITAKVLDTRKIYDRVINKDINSWLHYSLVYVPENYPCSFKKIMNKKEGGCVDFAYMYAYALRSVGVPASVDFIPLWGSQNAGHAEVVFMDSAGKMNTYEQNRLNKSAKVFRYIFKKENIWTNSIEPIIGKYTFLLVNLMNDYWIDVTSEHNTVCNISYNLPLNFHVPFCYICVYNYGEWQPVFYGKVNTNNAITFLNMSCNIFYQVAIPKNDRYELIGKPFIVDSSDRKNYFAPDLSHTIDMKLNKINTGYMSYVSKNKKYKLYLLNKQNKWQYLNDYTCLRDSVIFAKKIPANALYKLVDLAEAKRLERPFSYKNGKQIWW